MSIENGYQTKRQACDRFDAVFLSVDFIPLKRSSKTVPLILNAVIAIVWKIWDWMSVILVHFYLNWIRRNSVIPADGFDYLIKLDFAGTVIFKKKSDPLWEFV